MPDDQHHPDVFDLDVGDDATLVTTAGYSIPVRVTDRQTHHSDDDTPGIFEETIIEMEHIAGDRPLLCGKLEGLSPAPAGQDAYPAHFELHDPSERLDTDGWVPDEAAFGYVTEVRG